MLTLKQLCQATNGQLYNGDSERSIHSVHFDTRLLQPGSLFIALTGGSRDGHLFLEEAQEQGAIAAVISNKGLVNTDHSLTYILVQDTQAALADIARYYRQQLQIPVIAVTGSNGKTTTKDMIAHLLSYKKNVYKTYKNLNNHLGVPLSLLQIKQDDEIAVLEMGMNHAGEIDFLASLAKPDISVIVNVTDAHIENLGSRENISKAKGELLPHTSKEGYALLNADNPYVVSLSALYPGKTFFYSIEKESDIYATDIETNDKGTTFQLHTKEQSAVCFVPMFGTHNVSNVLPAVFIALRLGFSMDDISKALTNLSISPMRFELVQGLNDAVIINDAYNASPTSMRSSIKAFSSILRNHNKVLVLGDMFELGENSEDYHAEIGRYLHNFHNEFKLLVTIGEKSRFISDHSSLTHQHFNSKLEAIDYLKSFLNDQHAFLFKASRGMRLEEIINFLQDPASTVPKQ